MAVRARFERDDVVQYLKRKLELVEKAIVARLTELGERCVAEARSLNTYRDQSGNLRSSIGYVVVRNGSVVRMSGFEQVQPWAGFEGDVSSQGAEQGRALASSLANSLRYSSGYALIVVAGMSYAAYVEAKGYDVLDSAEKLAERELPRMLQRIRSNVKSMR
jgi:hypothetical protein